VLEDPDDPAASAIAHAARGLIAMAPVSLPVLPGAAEAEPPPAPSVAGERKPAGMSLPMA
jgi:hypothetical protein